MSYNPVGQLFNEGVDTGLNANSTSTVSTTLDIIRNNFVFFSVRANTGTHGTHIVTLQCSEDGVIWDNTSTTITGTGVANKIQITSRYVRAKVSTAEGGTSTIDITIQGK